ncbi:MAG: ribonuclease PH [bacterium]|nr:ribonuclease PH [bacterium]
MKNSRKSEREKNRIRKPNIKPDFCPNSYGSVLMEMGDTRIICAVSVDSNVPDHAVGRGTGWLSAEYSLLPYSTPRRVKRNLLKRDSRSVEIQRLIGRSLRGVTDLAKIPGVSITVDCDVLQADGGTRTASITGAFIALKLAVRRMLQEKMIDKDPILSNIAAISAGYVDNELLLDLDYSEDSRADVDMNIVMDGDLNLIEIQGTGEKTSFTIAQLNDMVDLAAQGIKELVALQNRF